MTAPERIDGDASLLLIADHASAWMPPGVTLGIAPALLATHIAVDLGTAALTRALAAELDAPAILATVSRLVIDLNRAPHAPGLIPAASDGHVIPGNVGLGAVERSLRLDAIHAPYHATIAAEIEARRPALLIGIHSFTPRLDTLPEAERPWEVALLHNRDDRAARLGLAALAARGLHVGDNEPYSGRDLNYTMDRHAEANVIPYLGFEVRQDGLVDAAGIAHWTAVLADTVRYVARTLRAG